MKQLGRYKLEKRLGEGAYAEVYKATDTALDRMVALKVLKTDVSRDQNALARFTQEAKALANLIHPHIAWVWDVGEAEGRYFIAMRYVDGPSLDKLLAERGPLPWEETLRVVGQVAEALQFAHEKGLVHRDVKPGNILLSEAEGAVLTDFGLVKALDASGLTMTLTATQGLIGLGTPHYMAPEQRENTGVGPAADQYALACVLCEMISGEKLFAGDTPVALMKRHVLDAPVLPEGLPSQAAGALAQALDKDPAARFETLKAFVEALAPGLRPSPISYRQSDITLTLAPGVTMTLVRVPAGPFLMGSDKEKDEDAYDDELPRHEVYLEEYWIGKTPVTVAQFAAFVKATGHKTTAEKSGSGWSYTGEEWRDVKGADWRHPRGPGSDVRGKGYHPVTLVSWHDARAFCQWASQVTGEPITLPSEAQWEKAARSPTYNQKSEINNRIYPWGDEPPDETRCNFGMNVDDTTPVGRYSPAGDSPCGCADMAGNVWEWTRSLLRNYPYDPADGREDLDAADDVWRVLRGGSFDDYPGDVRCAFRRGDHPLSRNALNGFRVVRSSIHR